MTKNYVIVDNSQRVVILNIYHMMMDVSNTLQIYEQMKNTNEEYKDMKSVCEAYTECLYIAMGTTSS